ncbi:MAG: V-type ATP synthase subunit A, partial [Bacteroidales bacterium]|nr:V-type ATP synthase subunit A [Bacteroidales bacterium]
KFMLNLILDLCRKHFEFEDYEKCRDFFKNVINLLRQMNYTQWQSAEFVNYQNKLSKFLSENGK